MKPAFWARRAHKWIGLVIGVQALLWMLSGVYMTVVPLDVIHGDHLAHVHGTPLPPRAGRVDADALLARYPQLQSFRLKHVLEREVYEVRLDGARFLVDAGSGERVPRLDRDAAVALARSLYQGTGTVTHAEWITRAPAEVKTRPLPMWAVHFDDRGRSTLYLSPDSGELLARRHSLWRWFDFVWMFHIMDYENRTDVNNALLRVASLLGLGFALSGIWLLLYSFGKRRPA
ncbi:PepSY domain-containing protein [Stenotrophomonas mori]|uniref:PepSY domain-containing protein n=1 Tax=Stenotrophomonas mori TaxID=2871096 RepID=A0ABT0SIS0_9GAMM|nr:PepSY domain-containing protein [Stenotrophomonas mori]MCL7715231.1 PepSY domain-containing protein [Stenotrophomonas mori]